MPRFDRHFAAALDAMEARDERRRLRPTTTLGAGLVERDGRALIDFSSNDTLGLSRHPLLIERARAAVAAHGAGAGASRLVTGSSPLHLAIERRIARWKRAQAALLFASGWQLNAAVLPAILKVLPSPMLFTDRLIHASLHHGVAASGVRQQRFRHNRLDHLEQLLARHGGKGGTRVIVTESVFSMDGDVADLPGLIALAQAHDAFLFVDEAHATGVLGAGGAGLSAAHAGEIDLVMGTFSKAMGSFGAYLAGSAVLCDYLANACSGFVYTTAPPPPVVGAIDAALDLVPGMDAERAHLARLGARLRAALRGHGLDVGASATHIVPVIVGAADRALAMSASLEEAGMLVAAIRPPTVPPGGARLRIALRATHGADQIDALADAVPAAAQ